MGTSVVFARSRMKRGILGGWTVKMRTGRSSWSAVTFGKMCHRVISFVSESFIRDSLILIFLKEAWRASRLRDKGCSFSLLSVDICVCQTEFNKAE